MRATLLMLFVIVSTVFVCPAAAPDPQSLIDTIISQREKTVEQANENYHKAVDPIIKRYQKIRDNAIKKANEKAMLRLKLAKKQAEAKKDDVAVAKIENAIVQLEKEQDEVGGEENKQSGNKKNVEQIRGITKEVIIPAKNMEGVVLGKLIKGQKIALSYVEGKWRCREGTNEISPDIEIDRNFHGRERLALILPSGKKMVVPTGTKEKPFVYEINETGIYGLVMSDIDCKGNSGAVKYKVTLIQE